MDEQNVEEAPFKDFVQQPLVEQEPPEQVVEQQVIPEKKSYWRMWLLIFLTLVIAIALGFYFLR